MVAVALRTYFLTPASEHNLTNPDEVHDAMSGLKFSKAPRPNRLKNRALKHLRQRAVSLVEQTFLAVLLTHHFPTVWKHARMISIFEAGKDPALPSSYRPISLFETIGKYLKRSY